MRQCSCGSSSNNAGNLKNGRLNQWQWHPVFMQTDVTVANHAITTSNDALGPRKTISHTLTCARSYRKTSCKPHDTTRSTIRIRAIWSDNKSRRDAQFLPPCKLAGGLNWKRACSFSRSLWCSRSILLAPKHRRSR